MSEALLLSQILIKNGALPDVKLMRMNTGVAKDQRTGRVVRFGLPGQSDVFVIAGPYGRFGGLEAKALNGRQSDLQKGFQEMLERLGAEYCLARDPSDVPPFIARLQRCPCPLCPGHT